MSLHHSARGRLGLAIGAFGASAILLAGCAGGGGGTRPTTADASGEPIIVGTTDKVTTLDPAGSYDNGSLAVQIQVFPYPVNTPYGSAEVDARPRRVGRVHVAHRVHGHAQARGPDVRQRQRPDLVRREVLVRAAARDRRPDRPVVPALQPRQRRDA